MTIERMSGVRPIDGERRFRMAFDAAAVGIALLDLNGRIVESNDALHDLLGYAAAELRGMTLPELTHAPAIDVDRTALDDVLAERRERCAIERQYLRKDGSLVWVRLVASVVRDAGRSARYGVAIIADITAEKRWEDQFLHAQKMAMIGRITGGIAHDLANLLTIIGGYAEFIVSQSATDDARRADAEEIRRATDRASVLTRQALALTRQRERHRQMLDVNLAVRDFGRLFSRALGEEIALTVRVADAPCTVFADAGHLQQILLNLAVNAVDAMPAGGSLVVETAKERVVKEGEAHIGAPDVDEYVRISVTDTGCGIPNELHARVFEPFFSTKEPGIGAGLGLSTLYGIATQAGGFVRLRSEADRGTSFDVLIPAVDEAVARDPVLDASVGLRGGETILLVEDDAAVRRLAARALGGEGYKVLASANGDEALAIAGSFAQRIDAVVTDVVMPGMSGPTLVARLETTRPDVRVLFISGHGEDMLTRFGVDEEETEVLRKPFTPDVLMWRVRQILG